MVGSSRVGSFLEPVEFKTEYLGGSETDSKCRRCSLHPFDPWAVSVCHLLLHPLSFYCRDLRFVTGGVLHLGVRSGGFSAIIPALHSQQIKFGLSVGSRCQLNTSMSYAVHHFYFCLPSEALSR